MGCFVRVTNPLILGDTGEVSKEKASGSTPKVSSKNLKEVEKKTNVLNNVCHFPLCVV